MTSAQAVRIVQVTQRKLNELCDELVAELASSDTSAPLNSAGRPAAQRADASWSLDGVRAEGGWQEIGRSHGDTYKWPDGNVDTYDELVRFAGSGGFEGMELALGFKSNGDVVGFVLSPGGASKRGITYFFPADDFDQTGEKVSMIRGGGATGRAGFGPDEAAPTAYGEFRVELLRDRKAGKWNVQGVVAHADDHLTMLTHTAIQARLRHLA